MGWVDGRYAELLLVEGMGTKRVYKKKGEIGGALGGFLLRA